MIQNHLTSAQVCGIIMLIKCLEERGLKRTDRDEARIMGEYYLPVITGNGIKEHLLALRLFLKYQCPSILCGKRQNVLDIFSLYCGFLQLDNKSDARLNVEKLIDLTIDLEEMTPLLILSRKGIIREESVKELESRFLIFEADSLDNMSFPPHTVQKRGVQNE